MTAGVKTLTNTGVYDLSPVRVCGGFGLKSGVLGRRLSLLHPNLVDGALGLDLSLGSDLDVASPVSGHEIVSSDVAADYLETLEGIEFSAPSIFLENPRRNLLGRVYNNLVVKAGDFIQRWSPLLGQPDLISNGLSVFIPSLATLGLSGIGLPLGMATVDGRDAPNKLWSVGVLDGQEPESETALGQPLSVYPERYRRTYRFIDAILKRVWVTLAEEEIQILGERQFEPEDLQTLHKIVLSFIERLLVDGKDKPLNYLIPRAVYRVLYPNNRELDSQVRFAMYMDHTAGGERFRLWVVETIGIVDVIYRHLARAVSENILKGDDATFLPGYERFVRRSNVPSEAYLYGRIPRSALGGTTVVVGPGTDTRAIDAALDRGEYVIVIEQVKAATAFLRGRYGKTIEYIEEDATKEGAWWSIQADLVISPYVFINEGEMKVALQHIRTGGAFVAAMTAMGPQRASDLFPLIGMGEKMEIVWDFFGSPVMETKTSVKYPSGIHTFIAVKGLDLGVDFAGMRSPEITRRSEERRNARLARMRMTELPLGDVEEIDITPLEARRQFKVKRDRFTKIWASYMSQKKLPAIGDVHNHVIGLKTLVLSIQKRILLSQSERRADWREWRAMEDRIDAKGLIRMIDSFLDEIQSRYLFL